MQTAREKILNDLSRYQKSYKFVVYKAFLLAQKDGTADESKVLEQIKNFYLQRKQKGLKIETEDTTSEISGIDALFQKNQGYLRNNFVVSNISNLGCI